MFDEVIRPGAFARAIKERQDVRALWNHNRDNVLGRTKSGTCRIIEDQTGLATEIDVPVSATREIESLERGDVDQMSFGFFVRKEQWTERPDDIPLREILDVDLTDVSPATYAGEFCNLGQSSIGRGYFSTRIATGATTGIPRRRTPTDPAPIGRPPSAGESKSENERNGKKMDPNKLKQQRKALLDEAEAIAAAAEGENRDLNAEERTAYEGKISAVDALDARIARAEEMQKRQGISTPDAIPGTDIVVPEENRHDNVVPAEELRNYSLYKAIRALVSGDRRGAEFEFEVSDAIATRQDANNGGLLIPLAVLGSEERQVTKANESELIATEHMAGDFIGLLRNRSITAAAGATVLDRLVGDISIPKQTAAGTAYWIGETGPVTSSVQTYGNVALAAKQVAARTLLTRLMAKQSSPGGRGAHA
jgi:HK97 family phage prohead protease